MIYPPVVKRGWLGNHNEKSPGHQKRPVEDVLTWSIEGNKICKPERARSYLKSYDINMGTFLWIHLILLVQSAVCVAVGTYIDFMFVILISDMS